MAYNIANVAQTPTGIDEKSEKGRESLREEVASVDSKGPHGPVVFEDYLHYAAKQRLEEDLRLGIAPKDSASWFEQLSSHKGPNVNVKVSEVRDHPMTPQEEDDARASRALRLAGWLSIFYLITTDILGPFSAPFAISQIGWVPGEWFTSHRVYSYAHVHPRPIYGS